MLFGSQLWIEISGFAPEWRVREWDRIGRRRNVWLW